LILNKSPLNKESGNLLIKNLLYSYDLKCFICYVGAHYLIFVSERFEGGKLSPMWKLFNDRQVQIFMDWNEVVTYCISSKCIPTVLFYELNNEQKQ
jgi:hypothetical protein